MTAVDVQIVRWVSDDPQPGIVEALLIDAEGRTWSFVDKTAVFSASLNSPKDLPCAGGIRCTVIERLTKPDGAQVAVISTSVDGVDSNGTTEFRVAASLLSA